MAIYRPFIVGLAIGAAVTLLATYQGAAVTLQRIGMVGVMLAAIAALLWALDALAARVVRSCGLYKELIAFMWELQKAKRARVAKGE